MIKNCIFVIIAGILWGVISIFVNLLQGLGFSSVQCGTIRLVLSAVIIFFVTLIQGTKHLKIKWKHLPIFIITGVLGMAGFTFFYFLSMEKNGGAAVPSLLLNTAPVFVTVFSLFLFKEKITLQKLIAIGLSIVGILFVTGIFESVTVSVSPIGIVFGILSGICYAIYSVSSKILLKTYSETTVSCYATIFAALFFIPLFGDYSKLSLIWNGTGILAALAIAVLCTVAPCILYSKGLKKIPAGTASVLATIDPATACLVGLFFFREQFSVLKVIGILLVLSAIVLQSIQFQKKSPQKEVETPEEPSSEEQPSERLQSGENHE